MSVWKWEKKDLNLSLSPEAFPLTMSALLNLLSGNGYGLIKFSPYCPWYRTVATRVLQPKYQAGVPSPQNADVET